MSRRFETERTFFLRPRSELLHKTIAEVREGVAENVPEFIDIPQEVKGPLTAQLLDDNTWIYQMAESLLRSKYRFPEDIPEEQLAGKESTDHIEELLRDLDQLTASVVTGKFVQSHGERIRPCFVRFYSIREGEITSINLTLNSYKHLPRWRQVSSVRAFLDEDGYRKDDHAGDYRGRGQDLFCPYRNPDGSIASYLLVYKGNHFPITPWQYILRDDYVLAEGLMNKVISAFGRWGRGEMGLRLD